MNFVKNTFVKKQFKIHVQYVINEIASKQVLHVWIFLGQHHSLKLGMLKYFVFNDNNPLENVHLLVMLSQLLSKTLGIYDVGFH
jgi:hypothetical protein